MIREGFLSLVILCSCAIPLLSQDQSEADSLRASLAYSLSKQDRLARLGALVANEQNRDTLIKYAHQYIDLAIELDSVRVLSWGYSDLATAYSQKGRVEEAVKFFHLSLETALSPTNEGAAHGNLGSAYQNNLDFERSEFHYSEAIKIFRELESHLQLGSVLVSLGYLQYLEKSYEESIVTLQEATKLFTDTAIAYNDYYWAYAAGNLALSEARNMDLEVSEERIDTVIQILTKYQDDYAIADYKIQMANVYFDNGLFDKAMASALIGAELAEKHDYRRYKRDVYEILARLYEEDKDYEKALIAYSKYTANKDSLTNADLIRQLANQRTEFEVGQKQAEVDLLTAEKETQRVVLIATAGFALILIVLAAIIYKYYRNKNRVNKILGEQKAELERLNGTKDKFFSIISHDLRGPVASFHGVSRLIKYFVESKETDQLIEIADEMDTSVDRLSSLLDNLLTWAMQQQGHFPHVPEKLNLQDIANDQIGALANMAKGKNISLSHTIDEPVFLWADKNMTMTIVRNLVNNALKFTPDGGSVTISSELKSGMAEIGISDTGIGIPQEKLDKLFQLQDKKSTYGTGGEKGLGLGLQLVNEFILLNGGSVSVSSEEGKGTVFKVNLPLFEQESEVVAQA